MTEPKEEASHADEIFGAAGYEAPLPIQRDFLPWHRPRKQYVRHHQWLEQIKRLLDETPRAEQTLRYLGLPGVDLLDLRYFHTHVCGPRGMTMRFLGFNTAANPSNEAQTALNISLDEVRRLPLIDARSDVLGDDFRGIANPKSIAWKSVFEAGPYDIINLDLCDGFGIQGPKPNSDPTHFDALNQLLTLQAKSKTPWLLLLTTRAGESHVDTVVLERFLARYAENLLQCPAFRDKSRELFGLARVPSIDDIGDRMLPLFLSGLSKWLLGLALNQQPPTSIEVKSVIGYRVNHAAAYEDLISIAFRCSPSFAPLKDSMGLAQQTAAPPDECALAVRVIGRIANLRDADKILREDADLRAEMIDATADLLATARYDAEAYRVWAAD
jgi:hypothetical protein